MQTVPAKHLLLPTRSSAWFGTDFTMNIYRGCNHGCIYCDSMSECYGIDDFGMVRKKEDALRILRDDLARKVKRGVISTGSMSDPYNSFEAQELLTRHALQLVDAYEFGIAIATKSDLITRDIDLLTDIAKHSPVLCKITITTMDDALAAKIEPRAPAPSKRIAALKELAQAGIYAGVLLMPVLPFLQDTEENIRQVVQAAGQAGARFVYPALGMTLRDRQREAYLTQLERLFPGEGLRARYEKTFGFKYQCTSPQARKLWHVFEQACYDQGLRHEMKHITADYKRPYGEQQLSFF